MQKKLTAAAPPWTQIKMMGAKLYNFPPDVSVLHTPYQLPIAFNALGECNACACRPKLDDNALSDLQFRIVPCKVLYCRGGPRLEMELVLDAMCSVTNMSCFVAHACAVRFLSNHTSTSRWLCESDEHASSVTCNAKGLSLLRKAVCKYQITACSLTFASISGNLDPNRTRVRVPWPSIKYQHC